MRITSEDGNTILEIILKEPQDPYSSYTFRAVVKDERNPFSGQNDGVLFSAFDSFLKHITEFIKTRKGTAVLEMTEDCWLELFKWNAKGDVGVRTQITKYGYGTDSQRMIKTSLTLEFKVDSEFVNHMYEDFTKLKNI